MGEMKYSIFMVAGRNVEAQNYINNILQTFGIDVITMEEARKEAREKYSNEPSLLDIVLTGMERSNEVFVLYTPDEYIYTKKALRNLHDTEPVLLTQPRPNVILELGMSLALSQNQKLNKSVTIIDAYARMPSDIDYRLRVLWDDNLIYHLYDRLKLNFKSIRKPDDSTITLFSMNNPLSDKNDDKIFYRVNNADGCSLVLKTRGTFSEFKKYFEHASNVCIIGAINRSFMRMITGEPSCCKDKKIKILLPSNCIISHNFDSLEQQNGRELITEITASAKAFKEAKKQHRSDMKGVVLRFYDCFISSSIYIFDEIIWLTPYGTTGADESPSFLVCEDECPVTYKHYLHMFDRIWKNGSCFDPKCNGDCNSCMYRSIFP